MDSRLKHLQAILEDSDLDGLALNPGPSLKYLTGLSFHLMERPVVFLLTRNGEMAMVLPELEVGKLHRLSFDVHSFPYGDDPAGWQHAFKQAAETLNLADGTLGIEPVRLRFLEMQFIQRAFRNAELIDGSQLVAELRMIKSPDELDKMRNAVGIAQRAMKNLLGSFEEGMSEKEIANQLVIELLSCGSDPELPFMPIVAFGENSADPHATPTDRKLTSGDLVLMDWGAACDGYFSDITRTFSFGEIDPELAQIGKIVMDSNLAGQEAVKPGQPAGAVDQAARSVITQAGYGDAFTHRTGHGLGLEAHEPPYLFEGNPMLLQPGMTFTIEPGIYLPGLGGIRIEDNLVVTEDGAACLTDIPREIMAVEDH